MDIEFKESFIELNSEINWELNNKWNSFFPFKSFTPEKIKSTKLPPLYINIEVDSSNAISLANFTLSEVEIPLLMIGEKQSIRFFIWSSPELYKLYYKTQNTKISSITEQILILFFHGS